MNVETWAALCMALLAYCCANMISVLIILAGGIVAFTVAGTYAAFLKFMEWIQR